MQDVVITHMHYDHAGNVPLFPAARFHVQDAEMALLHRPRHDTPSPVGAPSMRKMSWTMVRRVFDGRVVFHAGDYALYPGVTLHHLPGHTLGLQAVRVETARGPVVLASDAIHFWANLERETPFPVVADVPAYLESLRALRTLAPSPSITSFPGHDPRCWRVFRPNRRTRTSCAWTCRPRAAGARMSECGFIGLGRMGGAHGAAPHGRGSPCRRVRPQRSRLRSALPRTVRSDRSRALGPWRTPRPWCS